MIVLEIIVILNFYKTSIYFHNIDSCSLKRKILDSCREYYDIWMYLFILYICKILPPLYIIHGSATLCDVLKKAIFT